MSRIMDITCRTTREFHLITPTAQAGPPSSSFHTTGKTTLKFIPHYMQDHPPTAQAGSPSSSFHITCKTTIPQHTQDHPQVPSTSQARPPSHSTDRTTLKFIPHYTQDHPPTAHAGSTSSSFHITCKTTLPQHTQDHPQVHSTPQARPCSRSDLPEDVTSAESLATFCRILKTHLFRNSFPDYLLD